MTRKTATPPVIPESLNTPAFQILWVEFRTHRSEIRHPLTPTSERRLLAKLATYDVRDACAMIEQSIENGWRGVWPVHVTARGAGNFFRPQNTHPQILSTPREERPYFCVACNRNHKWDEFCPSLADQRVGTVMADLAHRFDAKEN